MPQQLPVIWHVWRMVPPILPPLMVVLPILVVDMIKQQLRLPKMKKTTRSNHSCPPTLTSACLESTQTLEMMQIAVLNPRDMAQTLEITQIAVSNPRGLNNPRDLNNPFAAAPSSTSQQSTPTPYLADIRYTVSLVHCLYCLYTQLMSAATPVLLSQYSIFSTKLS